VSHTLATARALTCNAHFSTANCSQDWYTRYKKMAHKASKARRSTGQDGLKQPTNVKKAQRAKHLPLLLESLRQSSHLISELK
jgi:hypothetical protein